MITAARPGITGVESVGQPDAWYCPPREAGASAPPGPGKVLVRTEMDISACAVAFAQEVHVLCSIRLDNGGDCPHPMGDLTRVILLVLDQ